MLTSEKVYKYLSRAISIVFLFYTVYICLLYNNPHAFLVKNFLIKFILMGAVISSIGNVVFSFIKNSVIIPILFLMLNICFLGAFQQTSLSLTYAIPVFLSYYTQDKKTLYRLLRINVAAYILSRTIRAYIIFLNGGYSFKSVIFGQILTATVEVTAFLGVVIPVFKSLIHKNEKFKTIIGEKENAAEDILRFCSTATSYHNKYLTAHIKGVKEITKVILDTLIQDYGYEINKYYYDQILFSVQFHDIGKIYIDSSILDKNGKLTDEEMALIKEHPTKGIELLSLLPKNVLSDGYIHVCKNVVSQHHERLDGSGYPKGLKGEDILFEARLVAVADVADALLSWRPYKPPMSWEKMALIFKEDANCYDELIVQALLKNKDKVLEISDENNKMLRELLFLCEKELVRS